MQCCDPGKFELSVAANGSGKISDAFDDGLRFFGFVGIGGDIGSAAFVVPITEGRLLMSGF